MMFLFLAGIVAFICFVCFVVGRQRGWTEGYALGVEDGKALQRATDGAAVAVDK